MYHHAPRPQPHVAIPPYASDTSNSRLHRSPSTSWVAYAAAANAKLDASNGYRDDGGQTPVASYNSNHLLSADPYYPASHYPPPTDYYQQQNGHATANGSSAYTNPSAQDYYNHDAISHDGQWSGGSGGSDYSSMGRSVSVSSYDPGGGTYQFPEPELQRTGSVSQRAPRAPSIPHRQTLSDVGPALQLSRNSSHSSYAASMEYLPQDSVEMLTDELSNMTLESEEGLRRFQAGELTPADEEWHKLVPETAREALGKHEVQRQSIIFEIFKSERDYVSDLEAVIDVFIEPLRNANVIGEGKTDEFIQYVFWNLNEILSFHQRMLASLFSRQRDQHPLIQSVSDVILETYESYIKRYPLSEARHRSELKRNSAYRSFLQEAYQDPRIRKRDLVTLLSRPVTRLPRLVLLLETLLKHTDASHPDQETMPLIISILGDFVKSTQPGIEAAENKVKFWGVIENLVFRKGEIIDIDHQDESRSLILMQTLARRQRSEIDWHGWNDYFVVLLDHYLLITQEKKHASGVKYDVSSRPIPLEFLRLGQFDEPSESRKEKSEEGGILESLRFQTRPQYPFTVYHAAAKLARRYTFYTNSEAARNKWHDELVNAIAVHDVRRDVNKLSGLHRVPSTMICFAYEAYTSPPTSAELFTGDVTAATTFVSGGRNYILVGCSGGIYAGIRGESKFRRVLAFQNAVYIATLQDHNRILIHTDNILLAYSMDLIARVSQGASPPQALDASMERVSGQDNVNVARVGIVKDRTLVIYATRSFRQTTIYALEAVKVPIISRLHPKKSSSFKSFGQPFYVPRQVNDFTPLAKTIAIAGDRNVTIVDPTNLSNSAMLVVPDFSDAPSDSRISALKSRCDDAKALGLARVSKDENMVVYEEFACYVDRHGNASRNSAVVRWETKATRFADRSEHILLFCADFVEVRHKASGRLVQVLEGSDIKLLNSGLPSGVESDGTAPDSVPLLVSRLGGKNDQRGRSIELFELVKTSEIPSPTSDATRGEYYWNQQDI
ncbi:hypothetical protein EW145_g4099 [Phellinidium pouzarii]|uniref:DH domain-containing protein n=1 Tax=Phellinidium pouzarii TaxID=167371 RepID=A0A4S4L9W1_9AGAM|nr:hypothetical protein EW145_g4099 [Phellinidium pouzarii]